MNNADLIVATLKSAGITRGFGIPSGNVLPLMEAMRQGGVDFVLTAHEGSAGFAADVTGRITGAPGLCIATLGPGATNLATGIGCAYLDRSPLIAITCNLNTDQLGRRIQMWIDHHALFKPITKATLQLRKGEIGATLAAAIALALSEPQGPVHLDLPEDVALAPTNEPVPALAAPAKLPPAADAAIERAAELIDAARRPIAVLGASAMRLADPALLASRDRAFQSAVRHHDHGQGPDRRGSSAVARLHRARLPPGAAPAASFRRSHRRSRLRHHRGRIRSLDRRRAAAADRHRAGRRRASVKLAHQVVGDLSSSLTRLAAHAATANSWLPDEIAAHRRAFQAALRPANAAFTAHAAIDAVRRALPRDGVLAFDVGAHTHQIASQWPAHAPKSFLITNGWSSMGFGLPGAIAAKLARPDLPVVCLIGDGCFQMTCGEVATAKRLGITLPIVVLDDKWLALIKVKQIRRQFPLYGTELQAEDYREPPAHYFGVPAHGVRNAEALEEAVKTALAADGPTVIEAVVDSEHYLDTVYD